MDMKPLKIFLSCLPSRIRKVIIRKCLPEFKQELPGITFRKAISEKEIYNCLKLINDVYVDVKYIKRVVGEEIRKIPQHTDPRTVVFMATTTNACKEEIPICTFSLFLDGPFGLPIDIGFKEYVDTLRKQEKRLAEVGCLASHPDYRRQDKNIPMLLNKLLILHIINNLKVDFLLITTHPKYVRIYEDVLLFKKIGAISNFSYVNRNPAVAFELDLTTVRQKFKKVYGNKPTNKNLYQFFFGEN